MPENSRYLRQSKVIGSEGQQQLKNTKLLVVGAGGLGTLVSSFLVAAGVGKITLMDEDTIAITNLTRQIVYSEKDCGQAKVLVLEKYLNSLNSECEINTYASFLNHSNADDIIAKHDVVVDCSDNFVSKYLVSDSCNLSNKPLITASIEGFNGQVIVLLPNICYRCIFLDAKANASCSNGDVIGPAVGIIASVQANEVFKLITGLNSQSQLIQIDSLTNIVSNYTLNSNPGCINNHEVQLASYEPQTKSLAWREIVKLHHNTGLKLIDIRKIAVTPLPAETILATIETITRLTIPKNQPLAVICNYGYTSKLAALKLAAIGYQQVYYTKFG
ncbi:MAG: ThiF family adenylyltransferase [Burkholderiales bacterium]